MDLGCGTGISTTLLFQYLTICHCEALDISEQSLVIAQNKLSDQPISWHHLNFDKCTIRHAYYDLIFSNMSLQWSDNIETTLHRWAKFMIPAGYFACTIPLVNNFPEIKLAYKPRYLSHQALKSVFKKCPMKYCSHK